MTREKPWKEKILRYLHTRNESTKARTIAHDLGISRGRVYTYLNELINNNLVKYEKKKNLENTRGRKIRYYQVADEDKVEEII